MVFSGYVSHAQLAQALGSQLAGDPLRQVLRAAAAAARGQPAAAAGQQHGGSSGRLPAQQPLATCRVSMRGPGGQGAADVAVRSYLPPQQPLPPAGASDAGHLPVPTGAAAQAQPSSSGRPNLFARVQLLARGVASAAKQAAAGPRAAGGGGGAAATAPGGVAIEQLHLRCALMALQVPVGLLAAAILEAV